MTAVAFARPARLRTARAMRLEIKHSPVVWALPVLGVIFYLDTYRTAVGQTPTWAVHASFITGHMLTYICVFGAGLGAWAGTREGRRKTGDLLATTARAAWARQATVFAATAFSTGREDHRALECLWRRRPDASRLFAVVRSKEIRSLSRTV